MNIDYYRNLRKKTYRVHLLSLGFKPFQQFKNLDCLYDITEAENNAGLLDWIKPI